MAERRSNMKKCEKKAATMEPQYQTLLDLRRRKKKATSLGLMTDQVWHDDPKRLSFLLSRYKFVAKMLSGKEHVLEIGCGDAFGSRIVHQEVKKLTVIDFDPIFIEDIKSRMESDWQFEAEVHDILSKPFGDGFDGIYSLDVIEHIPAEKEDLFMFNLVSSLSDNGVAVIGTPSIQSQDYANAQSKEGHVNCKDYCELKELMEKYFQNVFLFSMNDEVVHTGFYRMAHYLFVLCTGKKTV